MRCQLCVNFFSHFFTRNIVQSLVMNKYKTRLKAPAKAFMPIAITQNVFLVERVSGWGPEQRESEKTVLYLQIIIILISYIIINLFINENHPGKNQKWNSKFCWHLFTFFPRKRRNRRLFANLMGLAQSVTSSGASVDAADSICASPREWIR